MEVKVNWLGKMAFNSCTEAGHQIIMDGIPEIGGENKGAKPTELLLSAIGGCSGIDIVSILNKMRVQFSSLDMKISGERNEEEPRYFTKVHVHYILTGESIEHQKVAKAIDLSLNKYCSVSQSLKGLVTASYEVNGEKYNL